MKIYRKFFIKSPGGGEEVNYFKPIWDGGLIWEGEAAYFNLEKTTVSVLHKKLENKVHESGEAQEQEGWRKKIKSQISPHEVLQSWLIIQSLIF